MLVNTINSFELSKVDPAGVPRMSHFVSRQQLSHWVDATGSGAARAGESPRHLPAGAVAVLERLKLEVGELLERVAS